MSRTILNAYKNFIAQLGYKIIYDGSEPEKDSSVFFLIKIPNQDNVLEPKFAFYEIFMGAPLSTDGFEDSVLIKKDIATFTKLVEARIKGCTITKSEVLWGLLKEHMLIDDIYADHKIKFPKSKLKALSAWVNYQGAGNPRKRGEAPAAK
jgi:hypothetical protein